MKKTQIISLITLSVIAIAIILLQLSGSPSETGSDYSVVVANNQADEIPITCGVTPVPTSILSVYQLIDLTADQLQCVTTLSSVQSIEKSHLTFAAGIPSDPDWTAQHSLEQIQAPDGWDTTTGNSSLIVAVIDSGVDQDHPDLGNTVLPGFDFVNGDNNPQDDNGHGTHVAGIIAAQHNSVGIAGISPDVKILPVKVLDANGIGSILNSAMGIRYAVDNGADIINISYASQFESQIEKDAINYALNNGVIVVAASGDDGLQTLGYPAAFNGVISVGAITQDYQHPAYSNASNNLDLSAPGSGIYSTCLVETQANPYCIWSGTSMSAAQVSGLLVLLKAIEPDLSPIALLDRIKFFSTDIGTTGTDAYFGAGLIDIADAVEQNLTLPLYQILDSTTGDTDAQWINLDTSTELDFSSVSEIEISLPFPLVYGRNETSFSNLFVHKIGFITPTSVVLIDEGANLPVERAELEAIIPFWDNLLYSPDSHVIHQVISQPDGDVFVIEWNNLAIRNNSGEDAGSISFQAQIYNSRQNPAAPNNDIVFAYSSPAGANGFGQSASIGLAYGDDDGTQFCANAPQGCIEDAQALHFYHLYSPGQAELILFDELIFEVPQFSWAEVPFAQHYRLYISNTEGTFWNTWYSAVDICQDGTCSLTLETEMPDSKYYWWIQTSNIYGGGPWSEANSFTLITPPPAPTLTSPLVSSIINPPAFLWEAVENADEYRLVISDSSGEVFNEWLSGSEICTSSACEFTPGIILSHGPHTWQVQGSNQAGDGELSSIGSFEQINPPSTPVLVAPSGTIVNVQPGFQWVHSVGSDTYLIQLNFDEQLILDLELAANDYCNETSCTYTPANPLQHGDFSWRVSGSNTAGQGIWSDSLTFNIDALPGPPALIGPDGTIYSARPDLEWHPVEKATEYRIYVSNNEGVVLNTWQDASVICAETCTYSFGFDLQPGNHHWLVQPRNAFGSGPWSESMAFTIDLSPQKASLISPTGSIDQVDPVFSWYKTENVTLYRFYLLDGSGTIENTWLSSDAICGSQFCQYQLDYPLENGHYTWYIQTKNADQPGPWSDAGKFSVLALPETPTLISPVESIEGANVTLKWTDVFNTVEYRIYLIAPSGTRINQWVDPSTYCSNGECSYPIDLELYSGIHHWYIRGRNWAGNSAWTEAGSFEVMNVPGPAQLLSPEGTISSSSATLEWSPVQGSTHYRVYVTSNAGTLVNELLPVSELCNQTVCSYALTSIPDGTYTWYIQAKNDIGNGPWSESLKFIVSID